MHFWHGLYAVIVSSIFFSLVHIYDHKTTRKAAERRRKEVKETSHENDRLHTFMALYGAPVRLSRFFGMPQLGRNLCAGAMERLG